MTRFLIFSSVVLLALATASQSSAGFLSFIAKAVRSTSGAGVNSIPKTYFDDIGRSFEHVPSPLVRTPHGLHRTPGQAIFTEQWMSESLKTAQISRHLSAPQLSEDFFQSIPNRMQLSAADLNALQRSFALKASPVLREYMDDAFLISARGGFSQNDVLKQLAQAEAKKPKPRYTFEPISGKWTFNETLRAGSVEIKGGSINLYKVAAISAGAATCAQSDDCIEVGRRILEQVAEDTDFAKSLRRVAKELQQINDERADSSRGVRALPPAPLDVPAPLPGPTGR